MCSGVFGAVVAWHPDRLHRSPKELETFIEAVEAHAVTVETVRAGRHDFTTANGRLMARLTGAVARAESEQKSERVTRALAQRAAQGRPHGAVRYGWRRVYAATGYHDEVAPDQAAIVREVADRIVAGDSLRAIATDLGRRGVPTPQRSRVDRKTGAVVPVSWTPMTVRGLVLRATNVALRVHGGAVVGNGDWPPILDRGVWEQVKAILADPARKTSTGTVAKHLLSGIARCGVCGGPMRVALRTYGGGGHGNHATACYRCLPGSHVSRNKDALDEFVTRLVIGRLSAPDAADLLVAERGPQAAEAAEEAAGLRARLDNAADSFAAGDIDRRQLERITAQLRPQIAQAEARARVVDDTPLLDGVVGADDVAAAWVRLPLSRRRAIVDLLVTVTVNRRQRRGRGLDLDGIDVAWRS